MYIYTHICITTYSIHVPWPHAQQYTRTYIHTYIRHTPKGEDVHCRRDVRGVSARPEPLLVGVGQLPRLPPPGRPHPPLRRHKPLGSYVAGTPTRGVEEEGIVSWVVLCNNNKYIFLKWLKNEKSGVAKIIMYTPTTLHTYIRLSGKKAAGLPTGPCLHYCGSTIASQLIKINRSHDCRFTWIACMCGSVEEPLYCGCYWAKKMCPHCMERCAYLRG